MSCCLHSNVRLSALPPYRHFRLSKKDHTAHLPSPSHCLLSHWMRGTHTVSFLQVVTAWGLSLPPTAAHQPTVTTWPPLNHCLLPWNLPTPLLVLASESRIISATVYHEHACVRAVQCVCQSVNGRLFKRPYRHDTHHLHTLPA